MVKRKKSEIEITSNENKENKEIIENKESTELKTTKENTDNKTNDKTKENKENYIITKKTDGVYIRKLRRL